MPTLMAYGDILMAVSIVLRIKRTMDGGKVDKITCIEQRHREDWDKRELSAAISRNNFKNGHQEQ